MRSWRPTRGPAEILLAALLSLLAAAASGATYYVSQAGDDGGPGTSPLDPWKTIARVNAAAIQPGDRVLFHRGHAWREQLVPHSGSAAGHVTYGAYGKGPKPLLLGSLEANSPAEWVDEGGNRWRLAAGGPLPDVGNLIFDGEQSVGVKVWVEADLDAQGEFWYDEAGQSLLLYSTNNPAVRYADIECALTRHIINEEYRHHVIYEDLELKYGGAHGISGGETHQIVVRRCDLSYLGGGELYLPPYEDVRYGNGVEFWGNAQDNLVEDCRLWQIYDAALTNQSMQSGVVQRNIRYRNNLIWDCEYSFEYWNRDADSITDGVTFEHNSCANAGGGWSHAQRPSPIGMHLAFFDNTAPTADFQVRGNIFYESTEFGLRLAPTWNGKAELHLDYNCWYQADGYLILYQSQSYRMAEFADYQTDTGQDAHSLAADPLFAGMERGASGADAPWAFQAGLGGAGWQGPGEGEPGAGGGAAVEALQAAGRPAFRGPAGGGGRPMAAGPGWPGPGRRPVGFADFYLSQTAAGQPVTSPCVDAGDPLVPLPAGTTRTDGSPESGLADLGFHPPVRLLVAGPGPAFANPPRVRVLQRRQDGLPVVEFSAYSVPHYGVQVACGNLDGGPAEEILAGPGPGAVFGPHVRGFSFAGTPLAGVSFLAYGTNRWGVNVAAGDLDGDGYDEIVTGAGPGTVFGPHVRAFEYDGSPPVVPLPGVSFFAYGTLQWGVNVAAGDIDGDGVDEILSGAGPGAVFGPHVRGWNVDGGAAAPIPGVSFLAYGTNRHGVRVAAGDLDGDGMEEIVTAPGPSSLFGAHLRGWNFDGSEVAPLPGCSFFAWPESVARFGARVFAGADLDGDGRDELVAGAGPDPAVGTPVKVFGYDGAQVTLWFSLDAFAEGWTQGATVAAGRF